LDVHGTIGGSVIDDVCCGDYLEADCSIPGDNDGCCVKSVACKRSQVNLLLQYQAENEN
jgi:hypothetical protein